MINTEIRKALLDPRIGVPPYQFQAPEHAPSEHIVYTYVSDRGEMYSEGEEDIQWSEAQLDIHHPTNYTTLLKTVKTVLKEYGFYIGDGWGRYDNDLGISYYTLRILKEIEDASN